MVRVLQMIGSLDIGGSQAMIMNIYRHIDRDRIQFDFIIDHPNQTYFAEEIKALGGKIYLMPEFTGKNIIQIKRAWNSFFESHKEYRVLHSHVRSYASLYIPIANRHGIKTIVHSHSTSNGKGISSLVKACLQFPLRFEVDYFFGCSRESGIWLFGKKIVDSNKYYIIKNSVDTKKYILNSDVRRDYREELGIKDKKVIIHVGRLHPAKNHLFLLQIFKEYLEYNPNSHLLLVGDGELKATIKKNIEILDIKNNVTILGNRGDVSKLLQAADIFVFPSKWEGLPVTVVEAQAAGLPCLVSDHVTKEVGISDLVYYLPIDNGTEIWVNKMKSEKLIRKNVIHEIQESGFDVEKTTKWIMNFYNKISNL